ncbi:MAG: carbamoyltransferase C-terminal domain-containing protein [Verrucomicrobiota bacterium]|jgi:carbamoyltransferase
MNIIGINASGFHESSACLVQDGRVIFACAEERLSRIKQDKSFPKLAIQAALDFAGLKAADVEHAAFSFPRPWERYRHDLKLMFSGKWSLRAKRLEKWLLGVTKDHRHRGGELDYVRAFGRPRGRVHLVNHHLCHVLSSYCMSGFDEAAMLVIDGRGAHEATTLWHARGGELKLLETYDYPNSIGVFYAGITEMLGFAPFSDEWKVMGLAAYGKPTFDLTRLIRCTEETYRVEGRRFFGKNDYDRNGLEEVLGPRRLETEALGEKHQNLARSAQDLCEQAMLALLRRVTKLTGCRNLCLAGGVALNCKANGELLRSGLVDRIYVQPAAGDDGTCIGAALGVYRELGMPLPRIPTGHSYLGHEFRNDEIEKVLKVYKLPYRRVENAATAAAQLLAQDHLVGWFQGRMEFGPRALGNRSILSDPRRAENRDRVNEAVKFRESWRPFAPSVLEEKAHLYFQDFKSSPYMILSFRADKARANEIPAVVHVDGSCRVQSVDRATNPRYYELLQEFEKLTGVPVLMNTSFNLKGDPIVCSPKDAIQTFYTSGLDNLVIGNFLVSKNANDL